MNLHDTRHKENSKYAHYSRINKNNYKNYNLKNTNPIKITLKKGECLYIPRGYWHWIVSKPDTMAYNIWFNDDRVKKNKPFILDEKVKNNLNKNILVDLLGNIKLIIFNENINNEHEMTFLEYINAKINNSYLITLNDVYSKNRIIIDIIIKYLNIPKFLDEIEITKDNVNFWYNIEGMDTGLHYDDDDGILCVIDGIKDVLLFPPEDSLLLDGYKHKILWINNKIEDLLFNTYTLRNNFVKNENNKIHNNSLLFYSFQNLEIIRYINNLCGVFGSNNIIYGVKCDNQGKIRYEIYFYIYSKYDKSYLETQSLNNVSKELSNELFVSLKSINFNNVNTNNLIIHSFDIYNENDKIFFNKPNEKPKISLYYNLDANNSFERPFFGKLIEYDGNNFSDEFLFFLSDSVYIKKNIIYLLKKIKLNIDSEIMLKLFDIYGYVEDMCIYNKGTSNNSLLFCIQYFGLTDEDFYNFLKKYNYPNILINFYYNNYKKLDYVNKEITIHFELNNNNLKITRTAFYGSL